MLSDLRFAFRQLAKSPGFATTAALLLALAVGLNTAFFSVFNAQVLAPFPYPDSDRVVQLWRTNSTDSVTNPWSFPDYVDIREQCSAFEHMGIYQPQRFTLGGTENLQLQGVSCTSGVLRALGMPPMVGRWFVEEDEKNGAAPVVIISHAFWLANFGTERPAIGETVRLDGENHLVVGVMPANFEFYSPWTQARRIDVWVPLRSQTVNPNRGGHSYLSVARLKPNTTVMAANRELHVLSQHLASSYPGSNYGKWFYARSLADEFSKRGFERYGLVFAAVSLVLVAAAANLGVMFLARGAGRRAAYALRLAMGATRLALLRLAFCEAIILAFAGGSIGILIAWNLVGIWERLFQPFAAHGSAVAFDAGVLTYSLVLTIAAILVASTPAALVAVRTELISSIKETGLAHTPSKKQRRALSALIAVQVAIALALTNTAFLLLASYRSALSASSLLATDRVTAVNILAKGRRFATSEARSAAWDRVLNHFATHPETSAAISSKLPLRGGQNGWVLVDGQSPDPKSRPPLVEQSYVSPSYFAVVGIRLLSGRVLEDTDHTSTGGVVVNRAFVDLYWPGQNPIGKSIFHYGNKRLPHGNVVGVVENVRQRDPRTPAAPEMYFHHHRSLHAELHLLVRSATSKSLSEKDLRHALSAVDPDLSMGTPFTLVELVNAETAVQRSTLSMTGFFTLTTLVMAAIGIYGTLAFQVSQRSREIGLRMALGATRSNTVMLVLRELSMSLLAGTVVGVLLSIATAYALRGRFADVQLLNPGYYVCGVAALTIALLFASWLPALRATRVDPIVALRTE